MTEHLNSDSRYTFAPERTGHISGRPRYVVRFCGDFVASCGTRGGALLRAMGEKARREGALTITAEESST